MADPDIRWKQRFENFSHALENLTEAVELRNSRPLSNIEQQGFVKAFELTHELAWKVMKDYFVYQGNNEIMGSRDATREAFKTGMIVDGEVWMEMIKARNRAVHTYDEMTMKEVIEKTVGFYYPLFLEFEVKMKGFLDAV